ncbi:MAG: response regulator transcription factor [Variovorax sp.]|nr:MAG: response regulator transcription factor [Variovorax sp.]
MEPLQVRGHEPMREKQRMSEDPYRPAIHVAHSESLANGDPARINVGVLDSHAAVRFGLECRFRSECDINWLGAAAESKELAAILRQALCDVMVVEYRLEGLENDGWNLIRYLRRAFPRVSLLVYAGYMSAATISFMYRAGASKVVSKSASMDELINAVRDLGFASWHQRYGGRHPEHLLDLDEFEPDDSDAGMSPASSATESKEAFEGAHLSAREREVLRCLLQGMSVSQISVKFVRSIKTISSQKQSAFRKLSVGSDQDLFKLQQSFQLL